jgi:hypothetical protein
VPKKKSEERKMRSLEIISVRGAGNSAQQAYHDLIACCKELEAPFLAGANVYRNADVPGDLAIILSWEGQLPKREKTDLGLSLSAILKRFGLVCHVVWVIV